MLTFLELYQTMLGFVFFKLFTDLNLVYPPRLDLVQDEAGAGLGALILEESSRTLTTGDAGEDGGKGKKGKGKEVNGNRTTAKEVRRQIKEITAGPSNDDEEKEAEPVENDVGQGETVSTALDAFPTQGADILPAPIDDATHTSLFEPYFFFLSREVTRPTLEFVVRSFGGQVGWDPTLGAGSPFTEDDSRITHHVVDRPVPPGYYSHPGKRAYIQPQWVVDCVNRKTLLPTEEYGPGKTLPPHLSPFIDEEETRQAGGYVPETARIEAPTAGQASDEEDDVEEDEDMGELDEDPDEEEEEAAGPGPALLAAAQKPDDPALLHAAELEAEELGIPHAAFEASLAAETKAAGKKGKNQKDAKKAASEGKQGDKELAEIMLTGKQRKLYNKMSYTKERKAQEVRLLRQAPQPVLLKLTFPLDRTNAAGQAGVEEEGSIEEGTIDLGVVCFLHCMRVAWARTWRVYRNCYGIESW